MKVYKDENGLWHVDDVEICSTGIEYKLASGPHTFTEEELADAVKAADGSDIAIKAPRIKLGHSSGFNEVLMADAEPAFGRVENLRLSNNNQTILGDYVGTPEWLTAVLPVAYPSRSVDAQLAVETVTGKQYAMVITDVSLLGVRWPGCSVISDLPLWYGSETPEGVEIDAAPEAIAAVGGGMKLKDQNGVEAAVDVSVIRRKFYNDGPGVNNWAWWIRGERFDSQDGYNLIVDMGDGDLSRIPVTVDGSDIEFGDAVLVTEEYPDKAVAASAIIAGMRMADPGMLIHASRAETDDRPVNATQEGARMDEETRSKLANKLGLPEDATEEQINSKMAEQALAEDPPEGGSGEGDGETPAPPAAAPAAPAAEEPQVEAGVVKLDRETFESLKRGADLAASHEEERKEKRVSELVSAAIEDGRIPPARRDYWTKLAAADFDGTKVTLDGLEKGLIPVKLRGTSGSGGEEGVSAGQGEGLPESWFPETATIRAEAEQPRRVVHAKEG